MLVRGTAPRHSQGLRHDRICMYRGMVRDTFNQGTRKLLEGYNTAPFDDKYVRVSKVERVGDTLQSILKIKKLIVVEGGYKP